MLCPVDPIAIIGAFVVHYLGVPPDFCFLVVREIEFSVAKADFAFISLPITAIPPAFVLAGMAESRPA